MMPAIPVLLIELTLKSTFVLGIAWLAVMLLRRLSAAERHAVWVCALTGLLALPPAALLLPQVGIQLPGAAAPVMRLLDPVGHHGGVEAADPGASRAPAAGSAALSGSGGSGAAAAAHAATDVATHGTAADVRPSPAHTAVIVMTVVYAGIALLLLARVVIAVAAVSRATRRLGPIRDVATLELLEQIRAGARVRRIIALKISDNEATPWAWGWLRPVIVVPAAFAGWPEPARRNALLHEVSHVARLDFLTTLLGHVCRSLYWFQPLAWLALRRLGREAERACDDRVLEAGGEPTGYAAQLLQLATDIHRGGRGHVLACAAVDSGSLSSRINPILDTRRRRTKMGRLKAICMLVLVMALVLPVAALKSQGDASEPEPFVLGDPELDAISLRGPENSTELGRLVMTLLQQGREDEATRVISDYVWPHGYGAARLPDDEARAEHHCEFCTAVLASSGTRDGHAALPVLRAAFDEIEGRARDAGDGNPLIHLAAITGDARLGLWYLFEGLRLGNLTAATKLEAIAYLEAQHWYEPAKTLVDRLHDDPSSSLYQAPQLQQWARYLDVRLQQMQHASARLLALGDPTVSVDGEYLPIVRVAPAYPVEAAAAGLEGHVLVEFTVNEAGRTAEVTVVESSDPVFEQAAVQAASQFLYLPRIVNGQSTEVEGVQNLFTFVMQ